MHAQPLGDELLPAVGVLRLGGIGVLFLERGRVHVGLFEFGVDAGRGTEQVAADPVDARRLERVGVDQDVVVQDLGVVLGDESHPAHVGGQAVHLLDPARGLQAV